MKIIEYTKLYEHLTQNENLSPWEAIRNISKVRKLAPEILKAIKDWSDGAVPEISVNGVSYAELTEIEDLKPIQAFLMLDWLKRDPVAAMRFMETERLRSPIQPLSNDEKQIVSEAIKKLKGQGEKVKVEKPIESVDELSAEDKKDIEIIQKTDSSSEKDDIGIHNAESKDNGQDAEQLSDNK